MAQFMRGADVAAQSAPSEDAVPFEPTQAPVRPNRYGGKCRHCGAWVEAAEGILVGSASTGWGVEHNPGQCPMIDPATGEAQAQAGPATGPAEFAVPDGTYTVVWGNNHKTVRVKHQDQFDDFMPGVVVLSYLSGSNNDRDYTSFAHVDVRGGVKVWKKHQDNASLREAIKVLLKEPKAAAQAYAVESGTCWRCHRMLTTPESIARGLGEYCAGLVGW